MRTNALLLAAILLAVSAVRLAAQAPAAPAPAPAAAGAAPAPAPAAVTVGDAAPVVGTAAMGTDALGRATVTVDFPNEDIRSLLLSIAELFDLNIVVPESLQGRTSIKLRDVTWSQIFNTVLTPVGYTYKQEGNIIKVVSIESLQQEPTEIVVIPLNYASAAAVQPVISGMIDSAAGGKLQVDTRTNVLIITERPSKMNGIRDLIVQLDRATDQVMIETKFVEVTDGDIRNIGVNWSALKNYGAAVGPTGNMTRGRTQTGSDGVNASSNNGGTQELSSTTSSTVTTPASNSATTTTGASLASTADTAFNMLQSLANTTSTARDFGLVFTADQFGLVVSALNELSSTKIVSNPTIVTVNNKEAIINVGEQFPTPSYTYNEQRGSFEISGFKYEPIGINLRVTPQVNASGFITLTLAPEVSQRQGTVNFGGASGAEIPIIAARKATTTLQLQSGQTIGMGGLLTSRSENGSNKVPIIGDVPFLGRLFKSKSKNDTMTNLLIFITARAFTANGATPEQVFDPRQIRASGIRRDELPGFRDNSDPFAPAAPAPAPAR